MSPAHSGGKRRSPDIEQFRVRHDRKVDLAGWPTRVRNFYRNEADAVRQLADHVARTIELQELLYAADRQALLLVFQALDAAGKDGAISHVMSGVNPQGCQVWSFKQPSTEELEHDFLWRTTLRLPQRGRIGIFNRSHYEEVLVVRVHPEYLAAQRLPAEPQPGSKQFWKQRLHSIREYETHLVRNGTVIVKFFLHVSRAEQRERFLERIDHPDKNWKFSVGDVAERQHWDEYRHAYEQALPATSTHEAPWYVVPADDKKNARLIISAVINRTLESLGLEYPKMDKRRLAVLKAARRLLRD